MGKRTQRRRARRMLKAHDAGQDRHHKGLSWIKKQERAQTERSRQRAPNAEREDT